MAYNCAVRICKVASPDCNKLQKFPAVDVFRLTDLIQNLKCHSTNFKNFLLFCETDFEIGSTTGKIYLARSLDAEKHSVYVLQVTANDGHPDQPLTATMTLTVQVRDP